MPLLLLSGARKRELLEAKWEHFDLERRSWRIPTSKTGKARHVPLSAAMLSVLSQVPRWNGCSYVVANPKTKRPYVSIFCSWNTARKHTQLKTSQRYSHLFNETLLAAVDASANATRADWGPAQTVKAGENLALVEA